MHIRHLVCTDNFAGVERIVASSAIELARRGHTVDVLGGDPTAMRAILEPAGVHHVAVASTIGVARAATAKPYPDVIHAHMTAADIAAVATRPFVRRPIVTTLHFAQPRGHDALTRRIYGVIPKFVTAQVAISQSVADAIGDATIQVIHNGVDEPGPAPVANDGETAPRQPIVLVAQRFETEKDTATAIEAFALSGLATNGWELHLAGEGAQRDELVAVVERHGIADSVRFLGRVDDLDLRMWKASIFLASATYEPFGLSVVEAMAHALPVVATDAGGHKETIGTATPHTLYPPGDAAKAAELLHDLAADPSQRANLGTQTQARYHEAFTITRHVDQIEALYRRIAP